MTHRDIYSTIADEYDPCIGNVIKLSKTEYIAAIQLDVYASFFG